MRTLAMCALLALSGCSLFREELPDDSCSVDDDCFVGIGEVCDETTKTCVILPDAAPLPDAPPPPDADLTPDATPPPDGASFDGMPVDAGGTDA